MSQCKKFAPNIFHKTKCSNCFRQKEEHSAEALECNRASRSIARSGYLFVAPDWDFSVPLNRTKRWQRRWFVLYDDGELNYSVDEHPDTIPQGSVDMSKVLEVTAAEQVTGHPHSVALTSPDRVTFIKAASREDARWWVELLAMFPRRHKRNATFPGGRASPSLPQLGRSASPQPPRPRFLSCTTSGPSPRTNFETPPLKEERESPPKDEQRPKWLPEPTKIMPIEGAPPPVRNEYVVSSGSPPTRDKLRCDDKARARRDWRNERLRDIATALTDRSPESSLALPAEGLLHLKKGWLWFRNQNGEWVRRWIVLCVPTLTIYHDQDERENPEQAVELSAVSSYNEVVTESKYGFEIHWSNQTITLSAVTAGIRGNWLEALKKACPATPTPSDSSTSPTTSRSVFLSSDDEYKTASENDRRFSGDWSELPPSPPLTKFSACRLKERARIRTRLSRCQSRQNTVDSTSTDELDAVRETEHVELSNTLNKQNLEIHDLQNQLSKALKDKNELEEEIARLKKIQSEAMTYEKRIKDLIANFEKTEKELNQRNSQTEVKFTKDQKTLHHQLLEAKETAKGFEDKVGLLSRELQTKQHVILGLQEDLSDANDRYVRILQDNDRLTKKLKEFEGRYMFKNPKQVDSLTSLTDINLETNIEDLGTQELKEYAMDLKSRFEKAILEIQAIKRRLKEANENFDRMEIVNFSLEESMKIIKDENEAEVNLLVNRLEHLTSKLTQVEKQLRSKSKTEQREKRRSLSLKGRESFSINKEVEDKVTELEEKIVALEKGGKPKRKHKRDRSSDRSSPIDDKSLRRLRRKSLDSATASEPLKLLMRLSALESKVTNINVSTESLNVSNSVSDLSKLEEQNNKLDTTRFENIILEAKSKLCECLCQLNSIQSNKNKRSMYPGEKLVTLERYLNELGDILSNSSSVVSNAEIGVIQSSADSVVKQFQGILIEKLTELYEKKRSLIENNNYDTNAKLHYLAEKISFENIVIGRIQEAFNIGTNGEASCDRLISKEIKETAYLINSLKGKFDGKHAPKAPESRTSAEYLSKILAKALISVTHGFKNYKKHFSNTQPSLHLLIEEQHKLENQLSAYKSIKLSQLAETLASETMHLISDKGCILKSITNETKHQFTQATREKVNVELMQAEINHVLLRAAQIYQSNLNSDNDYFFSFFASERAALELWADSVEDYLYDEISKNINELTELYQNSLNKLQRQNWRRKLESERINHTSSTLLNEFADIVAHKALIDARINVLSGKFDAHRIDRNANMDNLLNNLINSEECFSCLENQSVHINQSLEAEFFCMVDKYSQECYALVERPEIETVLGFLNDVSSEIAQLQHQANVPVNASIFRSWDDVCSKCSELRESLVQIRLALKNSSSSINIRLDGSNVQRPVYLGAEYLTQVESMRSAYRCVLASCKDSHHESDIEQLKLLCEKVLATMEQWHHRTIQEMREKHSQEMAMLKQEKEQALKEETQATLAALDAMRKAHEAEVQREVAKFKQEFARQQRDEVMELSEKLSVKRLEAAALSEQLGSASRQLAHAQQHILALERNPQLTKFKN